MQIDSATYSKYKVFSQHPILEGETTPATYSTTYNQLLLLGWSDSLLQIMALTLEFYEKNGNHSLKISYHKDYQMSFTVSHMLSEFLQTRWLNLTSFIVL